jgi:hypothetical protein
MSPPDPCGPDPTDPRLPPVSPRTTPKPAVLDTVESAPLTRRGRALAETSSQPPCVGEARRRRRQRTSSVPLGEVIKSSPFPYRRSNRPHRRFRQRVQEPLLNHASSQFTEPRRQLIWPPGPKRTSARSGGRRGRTRALLSKTQCRKEPDVQLTDALKRCCHRKEACAPQTNQSVRRPTMGQVPPPETKPSEPTRHPDCHPAGPETMSPPLRSYLHGASKRDADDRPGPPRTGRNPTTATSDQHDLAPER